MDDDEGYEGGAMLALAMETCQVCGWTGMVMADDEWTCKNCKVEWESITFMVPKADMDDFCGKAADALGGYFQRIRPSPKEVKDGA